MYLSEYSELDKIEGYVIATITVLHEKTEKNEELFHLQHEFGDMITAYLHSHLTKADFLEVLAIARAGAMTDKFTVWDDRKA